MTEKTRLSHAAHKAKSPFFVGVDVGGTSIKIGLVDDQGTSIDSGTVNDQNIPLSCLSIRTEPQPQIATKLIAKTIQEMLQRLGIDKTTCQGIGLGIPGTMDKTTRKLRQPPNLHSWEGFPICDELAKLTQIPVLFCNDANAAAYGEYWVGSASGQPSMALLTLGTGIGCGIIIEGRSIDGATGYGGECGHLVIDNSENALLCGCGQRGHLEAYCSAIGVARRTINLTDHRESSIRSQISPETKLSEIAKIVYHEANNGDKLAYEIIMETAKYLSLGIVSLINTIDPACILLGGAMTFGGRETQLGQHFLKQVTNEVKNRAFKAIAEKIVIDFAILGSAAGYIGAAGLAREESRQTSLPHNHQTQQKKSLTQNK
ncbi:MAG: ROK family protein [Planctomycetaceae bacterium]|jgi:glucokinase|nr:ROK family protein [Planctomycetaceae bacterium]